MKVAIATEGTGVSAHFGRCSGYTIYDVDEGKVKSSVFEQSPEHQPGYIPKWLNSMGVNVVIAGGAGAHAQELFDQMGIRLYLGATGEISEVIKDYTEGKLEAGESSCDHEGPCEGH
ncbi:MAG: NifB/NifX family molybdenum-iron cluster-binding protein [Elusimicrobia bacterium]|nr:NifB/NifX family molybdenum-iron cluster-binding protein [Elusimicrobiota bacterium]